MHHETIQHCFPNLDFWRAHFGGGESQRRSRGAADHYFRGKRPGRLCWRHRAGWPGALEQSLRNYARPGWRALRLRHGEPSDPESFTRWEHHHGRRNGEARLFGRWRPRIAGGIKRAVRGPLRQTREHVLRRNAESPRPSCRWTDEIHFDRCRQRQGRVFRGRRSGDAG